jgi:hypothetical protein
MQNKTPHFGDGSTTVSRSRNISDANHAGDGDKGIVYTGGAEMVNSSMQVTQLSMSGQVIMH